MKTIDKWEDLLQFGIDPLTWEACSLNLRLLCDYTAQGKRILEKCLGLKDLGGNPPWNSGSDADPHVGSTLLTREMLVPIGIFALMDHGCNEIWQFRNGFLFGVEPTDPFEEVELSRKIAGQRVVRVFQCPNSIGRNTHRMTGRTE